MTGNIALSIMKESLKIRYNESGGYREVLRIGLPLVASMASVTVMQFTDRLFLSNYSVEAISACVPAGIAFFLAVSFFFGTVEYVSVFVAQYTGSCRHERVGAALWQGIIFCFPAALILTLVALFSESLFALSGHPEGVWQMEARYYEILSFGSIALLLNICLSCFFSGRGLTKVIMLANLAGAIVNIPLDYCLINGIGPFPELGIVGAALATVVAWVVIALIFGLLIFTRENDKRFAVFRSMGFDGDLFGRFMKFGFSGGLQFFIDLFAVTFFVMMAGRLGVEELAATNIACSIHSLVFLPMIGFTVAASVLVGQAVGAGKPERGKRSVLNTTHLTLAYSLVMCMLFVLVPEMFIELFRTKGGDAESFEAVVDLGVVMLRFVAIFGITDGLAIVFFGALKGAGDVIFPMLMMIANCALIMVLPMLLGEYLGIVDIYFVWICLTAYAVMLALLFALRFHSGRWMSKRVIENE